MKNEKSYPGISGNNKKNLFSTECVWRGTTRVVNSGHATISTLCRWNRWGLTGTPRWGWDPTRTEGSWSPKEGRHSKSVVYRVICVCGLSWIVRWRRQSGVGCGLRKGVREECVSMYVCVTVSPRRVRTKVELRICEWTPKSFRRTSS